MGKETGSKNKIITILLIVNIIFTAGIIFYLTSQGNQRDSEEVKYTLYIGTNDKDTYKQEIPFEEAKKIVDDVCAKYSDGFTGVDATGYWVDESDEITSEQTLVYSFYGINDEIIHNIMDELLVALNQNSILMEKGTVESEFYDGGN